MAEPPERALELAWEMSISQSEFLRSLPGAVGGTPQPCGDGCYRGSDGQLRWEALIEPMGPLRIAGISLERHRVTLRLRGSGETARRAFLARWEVHFRRGGG